MIVELSKYYFKLRDEVWTKGEGHTKAEIHKLAKDTIMPMLIDEQENFNVPIEDVLFVKDSRVGWSTLLLSELGWKQFIEQFKSSFLYT